jgi:hypothetical protein
VLTFQRGSIKVLDISVDKNLRIWHMPIVAEHYTFLHMTFIFKTLVNLFQKEAGMLAAFRYGRLDVVKYLFQISGEELLTRLEEVCRIGLKVALLMC